MRKTIVAMVAMFMFAVGVAEATPPNVVPNIKTRCAVKWPGDYRLQDYCRKRQMSAADWVIQREASAHTSVQREIIAGCFTKWTDANGPDWQLVKYCTEKQTEAYNRLN